MIEWIIGGLIGTALLSSGKKEKIVTCPQCKGVGYPVSADPRKTYSSYRCPTCGGNGRVRVKR